MGKEGQEEKIGEEGALREVFTAELSTILFEADWGLAPAASLASLSWQEIKQDPTETFEFGSFPM